MSSNEQDGSVSLWPVGPLDPGARARLAKTLFDNNPMFLAPPEVSPLSVEVVTTMAGGVASRGAVETKLSWLGAR